jgi:hypothetical protein
VPATFAALGVVILAILPGAAYTFAYESRAGAFNLSAPDRIVRFLAVSAIFHTLAAPLTYYVYSATIHTGSLADGELNPFVVQAISIAYIGVPVAVGLFVGTGQRKKWHGFKRFTPKAPEPRAWDYLFRKDMSALVRIKLKSGIWLAGIFGQFGDDDRAYASCYPEDGDLYLARGVQIHPDTGILGDAGGGQLIWKESGFLVRWNEIEYLEITPKRGSNDEQRRQP